MSQVSLSQQLKEGNLFAEQCPSREVLKHVTSRWGVLILVALREGTHRFSDLRRKIGGVSEKMLFLTVSRIRWCRRMWNTASRRWASR